MTKEQWNWLCRMAVEENSFTLTAMGHQGIDVSFSVFDYDARYIPGKPKKPRLILIEMCDGNKLVDVCEETDPLNERLKTILRFCWQEWDGLTVNQI